MKPYPKMKDSGVPWLGAVPEHWEVEFARWLFHRMDRPPKDADEVVTCFRDGVVTLRRNRRVTGFTESLKEIGYQGIRRGDLVIHAMDAFAGAIGVSDSDGKGSPVYSVCQPRPRASANYFALLLREMARSGWIEAQAKGIRERSTDFRFADFAAQPVPVPTIEEQESIVRFLDYADRQIGRDIRAKQKLIKLLEEQKQAIIHQSVSLGIDPNVRLKPSGVEWLGDIPEHWEVKRLKWATRLQRGYDLPADRRIPGPYPVVSSGGLIGSHVEARAKAPGVAIGRYGSTEAVFFLERDYWPHNTSLFVTDFQGNYARWAYYMLRTISKADHSGKSAVPGVDRKDLFDIRIPVPSPAEQTQIARHADEMCEQVDGAISAARNEIVLLRELGVRLISEVTTGHLDVREAVVNYPKANYGDPLTNEVTDAGQGLVVSRRSDSGAILGPSEA
ncbi:MAG: restriction endonuclease subunit S [Actinomycetota bacterium]